MEAHPSLQDRFAPKSICFGCGPANSKGLRIKSFEHRDEKGLSLISDWTPEPHHAAFQGILNGGIIGALLDCHSNWTAAFVLMQRDQTPELPSTVTSDFHITLKRPTPTDQVLRLMARPVLVSENKVSVEATLESNGKISATCVGTFVSVPPGHPAFHRWL
jgi:acyl-coenzyme A thioesterase PaaI-like protein